MQDLAATPPDSKERFEARRLLPGMAKRLRDVRLADKAPIRRRILPTICSCTSPYGVQTALSQEMAPLVDHHFQHRADKFGR